MLVINVPVVEDFDDEKQEWIVTESFKLEMEHSLATLSKWESFFEKPFLGTEEKTPEELFWYFEAMIVTPNVPPKVMLKLVETRELIEAIDQYINAKMTATWFNEKGPRRPSREVVTAEIIYHWMISHNIWLECEHWHLNRLLTLIKVCNQKNTPPKKMSRREMLAERAKINARRKAELGTSG